ncbi:hypothetical protein DHD32_13135 [Arenibacter sp. TNZ]|nr:hypothetical protein [Arenibacter sp. TNZ]
MTLHKRKKTNLTFNPILNNPKFPSLEGLGVCFHCLLGLYLGIYTLTISYRDDWLFLGLGLGTPIPSVSSAASRESTFPYPREGAYYYYYY